MSQLSYYEGRIGLLEVECKTLKNRSLFVSWMRLVLFMGFAAFLILFFTVAHYYIFIAFSVILFVSFIVVAIKHNLLEERIMVLLSKIQINEDEIQFLNHNYHHRKSGSEFVSINPFLSNDFDLFGKGSLFQYLNRCNTNIGRENAGAETV